MPWTAADAKRHTHRADTDKKRRQWAAVANASLKEHGDEGRAIRAANAAVGKALLFCDCVKDAGMRSVHAVTALGNEKKRRDFYGAMASLAAWTSAKKPNHALKPDDQSGDIVKRRARVTYPRASLPTFYDFVTPYDDAQLVDDDQLVDDEGLDDDEEDDEDEEDELEKQWKLPLRIKKYQPDQQLIFGWASVVEKDGKAIIDKQGDVIPVEELEHAAYEFTLNSRDGGDMHARRGVAKLVESMVFTAEKQKALGVDLGQVGWWVGFKVHDPELWAAHKRGERPEFSIGGAALPVEIEDLNKRGAGRRLTRFPFRY